MLARHPFRVKKSHKCAIATPNTHDRPKGVQVHRPQPDGALHRHDGGSVRKNTRRRTVEYSIGWPFGEPERAAITALPVSASTEQVRNASYQP
ncbi:hypothetical protein EDC02_2570 [Micromonospora sp. Llam0]|uniref:hypothetical protein n=1 Tax=Micromonospora sp. Llam0 TaxID=2485143 RepID=UPI000F4AD586|nr:hypothetical protein [Micromonospora sp. Llam0]ROO60657.1 hypothetical protein EDC02_2570 [Micromonospora sp. Llam0]